jgi:hypothetical protein
MCFHWWKLQAWWSDWTAVRSSLLEWLTRMHIFSVGGKLNRLRTSSIFSKLHMGLEINERCDNTWKKIADSHQLGVSTTRENDPRSRRRRVSQRYTKPVSAVHSKAALCILFSEGGQPRQTIRLNGMISYAKQHTRYQ